MPPQRELRDELLPIVRRCLAISYSHEDRQAYHFSKAQLAYNAHRKTNTKNIIGAAGVRDILQAMADADYDHVKTVCIGGINAENLQRIVYQSEAPSKKLDGVAVVSALVAAPDPEAAAKNLVGLFNSLPPFVREQAPTSPRAETRDAILDLVPKVVLEVAKKKPLSHNMTNLVRKKHDKSPSISFLRLINVKG